MPQLADGQKTGVSGSLEQMLGDAASHVESRPVEALAYAREILRIAPGHPHAQLIQGQALRRTGEPRAAMPVLAELVRAHPRFLAALWELAQAASAAGETAQALSALESLTRQQPAVASGWFLLAKELRRAGRGEDAWRADLSGVGAAARDPALLEAAVAMKEERLDAAEAMLRVRLDHLPDDPPTLRLLGETLWRRGDLIAALEPVGQAVENAPGFDLAREFLIRLLLQANRLAEALDHATILCTSPLRTPGHELLRASVLVRLGDQEGARTIYETQLARRPEQPQVWQNLGHVLKTLGQQADAVDAYRRAVTQAPTLGEAWWSLANLKTVRLGANDIAAMEVALASLEGSDRTEDIFHLHFSLGKALEDAGNPAASFRHYDQGNRLRRTMIQHDADAFSVEVAATAATFTAPFLASRSGGGCPAPDPIFIVGLPRSGSTLVEQILSSHSRVEGTMELPDLMSIAARLHARVDEGEFPDFATMIASLSSDDRRRLGEEYIDRTRVHRQTDRPLFIDKLPNNWQHVGLISLILPNAKIVDARRHPMGCCFSGWKQHFARGQAFTYDLADIGRYYRDYVALMASFDAAAPGRVHRVIYEQMVADTAGEVTRLLDHLGLPFEEACLGFWRTERAVRTASSEQVRQPIFNDAVDHWRAFEPWLGPLAEIVEPIARTYPHIPSPL